MNLNIMNMMIHLHETNELSGNHIYWYMMVIDWTLSFLYKLHHRMQKGRIQRACFYIKRTLIVFSEYMNAKGLIFCPNLKSNEFHTI